MGTLPGHTRNTMKLFYCDHFTIPLPDGHHFPMAKYALLRDRIVKAGLGGDGHLQIPAAATDKKLLTVHEAAYLERVIKGTLSPQEIRRIGFPWSPELVERSRRSVGGTIATCRTALEEGFSMNLSGGTHHAFPDHGEGFCVFNDVGVAARVMQEEGLARRVAILDLDVHQGNGTAFIFRKDPTVFTLSLHGANNYPFRKEAGDLDMELPDGTEDGAFLEAVSSGVRTALDISAPELALYLAGADPFQDDRLGRLGISREGLAERDRIVFSECQNRGIPVAVVMGGGYAPDINDTVEIHLATAKVAAAFHGNQ